MKTLLTIIAFVLIPFSTNVQAQIKSQPIKIFDGSSLENWGDKNGNPKKNWIIDQDGNLHRAKRGGDLYYTIWFQDFELTFKWKIAKGGNSGVKYRVQDYNGRSLGCEYQLQDDSKINKQSAGGLYALYAPNENRVLKPVGEWNESKIVVCGNKIEHWLNGVQTVSAQVGTMDWLTRVADSKFKDNDFFGQNRWGRIFLQDHGNPVWFREITITPLICETELQYGTPNCPCPGMTYQPPQP